MSKLESIVRPFLPVEYSPPKIVPFASATKVATTVKLRIGRNSSAHTMHGSVDLTTTLYTKKYPRSMTLNDLLATPGPIPQP